MFLSNHIAGFFDHQYPWKETISVLDILHRDSCQEKIASKKTTIGWVWLGKLSHASTCLNLSGVTLVGLKTV